MTTLIVDGTLNFVRCWLAYPSTNADGEHFGAVVGFLRSLRSFVQVTQPSQVIIVFDGAGGSQRRRSLDSDYKAGSKPARLNRSFETDANKEARSRLLQEKRLREYLADLPVSVVDIQDIEADDVIAFLTQWLDGDKVIASNDKDFLQLLNPQVRIYRPTKRTFCTHEDCFKEYGIIPANMALARAIAGDSSDNLKGVKGIGLKTLVKTIPEFGGDSLVTPEQLFTLCEQNESSKASLIAANKQLILHNYDLMRLTDPIISAMSMTRIKSRIKPSPSLHITSLRIKLIRDAIDIGMDFHPTFLQLANAIKENHGN